MFSFARSTSDGRNDVGQRRPLHSVRGFTTLLWPVLLAVLVGVLAGCGDDEQTKPPVDTASPAAVADLTVAAVTDTSATLGWTAPGDDGATGTAQAYEIRRSMTTITEVNWAAATQVPSPPTPKAGGSTETLVVRGLSAGTLYFFALKTIDDAGNRSALSNMASDTTSGGEPAEVPVLAVSPAQLDFGADLTAQTLTIRNTGTGTLVWTVTEDQPWLSVDPTSGSTTAESDEVTVTIDRTGLSAGEYSGTVTVTPGTGTSHTVGIQMSIAGGGGFVLLPPGTFTMGSPADEPGRDPDETPHLVTLTKAVYVATHEVTQSEWQSVMGWNESFFPGENRPVEWVTWFDCVSYCNQRSTQDGYTPAYSITDAAYSGPHIVAATVTWDQAADGYRLLTEAEWEYACRAGSQTAFCNGEITNAECSPLDPNLDLVGWYCGNASSATHDVGGKAGNAWGLQDIHGNVQNWCWDWHASYPAEPVTDPIGPPSGSYRVYRGGSWYEYARHCRSAARFAYFPLSRYDYLGLRLARTAP